MKTHTIRGKSAATPIVSFTPAYLERLLAAGPEATALTLGWFTQQYRQLTGKSLAIDHKQDQVLRERAGADGHGQWTSRFSALSGIDYRLMTTFERGFMAASSGLDLEEALDLACAFYRMLATANSISL